MIWKNNRAHLYHIKLCAPFQIHQWIQTEVTVRKRSIGVKIGDFCPVWPWNLENNRAPLLYYTKLCASFQSHGWIQIGVTVRKHSIRVKIGNFFVPCDFEIWWLTSENNRAPLLYYIKLCASFESHGCFKLELQYRNAQFGSKSGIFCPVWSWNLTNDLEQGKSEGFDSCDRPSNLTQIGFKSSIYQPVWPWNLMDDLKKTYSTSSILRQALCIISNPSVNSNWICSLETLNSGQNCRFFVPRDLEIWWMILENNRTSLLY